MAKKHKTKLVYYSAMISAASLMLLRICDQADIVSVVLCVAGMTALVYSIRHAHAKAEYIMIALIMAVTYAVRLYGYTGEPAADLLIGFLIGLIMFALAGAERLLRKFEDRFWYTLIFPVSYMLLMYFTEILKINMPFRTDIYLSNIRVLCQITAVFGIYFLDFLLGWTASVLAFFIDFRLSRNSILPVGLYITALCAILCFGLVHIEQMNLREAEKEDSVCVACATGPYYGSFADTSYEGFTLDKITASMEGIVEDASEKNAEILLFSEEAYCISDKNEAVFMEAAKKTASGHDIHLLLAYEVYDTDQSEAGKSINKLCWVSNEGEVLYEYIKHCLVPVVETSGYVKGDQNIASFDVNVHGKNLKVATAICYDADFDVFMSHMGKRLDLLLLPTWDWEVIAEEHFSVARLRAIANETTLIRSVYDGWSAVIDSTGKVLVQNNMNEFGYGKVFTCDVPVK